MPHVILVCYSAYHHHDDGNSTLKPAEAFRSSHIKNHVLEDGFTHITRHSPCTWERRETAITLLSLLHTKNKGLAKNFEIKHLKIEKHEYSAPTLGGLIEAGSSK